WRTVIEEVIRKLREIHEGGGRAVIDEMVGARRTDEREAPDVVMLHSIPAGLVLAEQVTVAQREMRLDSDLFADAFGVASWAINVDVGTQPDPFRVSLLADSRIAFVVGFLSPLYA